MQQLSLFYINQFLKLNYCYANVGVAEQIKDLRLPSTYIEGNKGGGNANGSLLQSLIGADLAKKMMQNKK